MDHWFFSSTEKPRNKASANKVIPPITTWIFSPHLIFLLILYIGNKASMAIRHKINRSLEMPYCGVPLYVDGSMVSSHELQLIADARPAENRAAKRH